MVLPRTSMPPKLPESFLFSQGSLQDYSDCPRRFYLRHIAQIVWPAVEAEPMADYERRQEEGLVFHRLVQQHLLGVPAENLTPLASDGELGLWWQNYLSTPLGLVDYTLHTELALSSQVGRHRFMAKYDLVVVRDSQALIYDWKTYSRRPSEEQLAARWQTRIYRLLLIEAGAALNSGNPFRPEQTDMIYWFAAFPSEPARFHYDEAQMRRDRAALKTLVDEISSARDFPMTGDRNMCRFCNFRSYCDRGRQAGQGLESDSDSNVDAPFEMNLEQIAEVEF